MNTSKQGKIIIALAVLIPALIGLGIKLYDHKAVLTEAPPTKTIFSSCTKDLYTRVDTEDSVIYLVKLNRVIKIRASNGYVC